MENNNVDHEVMCDPIDFEFSFQRFDGELNDWEDIFELGEIQPSQSKSPRITRCSSIARPESGWFPIQRNEAVQGKRKRLHTSPGASHYLLPRKSHYVKRTKRAARKAADDSDHSPGVEPVTAPAVAALIGAKLLKPLSAYNYFYRVERGSIVSTMKQASDPLPDVVCDYSHEKQHALLQQRWFVDPIKEKRRHRKDHGVIDFLALSQVISQRWQSLSKVGRDFYRRVAQADLNQYEAYLQRAKAPEETATDANSATTAV